MSRRVALAVALPLLALGAVVAVVVAGGGGGGGGESPTGAGRAGTEAVARRTLVDRAQLDGTLGYGGSSPAMDRLGGTITWLPATGATIRPGRRLFAVDGEPVILMDGAVPAWRTLASGIGDGVDVRQLERNLAAFGYDPGTVDASFTAATSAAVEDWQDAAGLPVTGEVELGRVVFLRGPRRVAEVEATLGSAGGGGGATVAWDGGAPQYVYAAYAPGGATATPPTATPPAATTPSTTPTTPSTTPTTPRTTPTTPSTTPTTPSTTPTTPSTATPSTAPTTPSGDDGDDGEGDAGGAAATEVLSTTSTARVVTVDLDAADQALARVGVRAVVTLPDGRRVGGRVIRVGTVVTGGGDAEADPSGEGGEPTLPLTIRLRSTRTADRLDEAPVTVELARTKRRDVLAVPVAALVARAGGGYAVTVVRSSGATVEVPVEPGLFADGYVELAGGGVREGDRVRVPR